MNKYLARASTYAFLTVASFFIARLGVQIWILFLFLSLGNFATYLDQKKRESSESATKNIGENIIYGKLGSYIREGDECYGLYIEMGHKPVFVDVTEDEFVDKSEKWAVTLFENTKIINDNFQRFVAENPSFQGKTIYCIGLDSKNPTYGEIIWDSGDVDKKFPPVALTGFDFVFVEETPWWKPVW
jgi:hypothetical protein